MGEEVVQATEPMRVQGFRFKAVEHTGEVRIGPKRKPPAGKVVATGRMELNVAATEKANGLAKELKLDVDSYVFKLKYDEEAGLVALYPKPFTTLGCSPVRRNITKKSMTTYLHQMFEEAPSLRPTGIKHCPMTVGTDDGGNPCLILSLFAALSHRVMPRAPKEEAEAKNNDGKGTGTGSKGEKGNGTGEKSA